MLMDVHQRGNLRFPQSLPEFQRFFPDDAACAAYLEKARRSGVCLPPLSAAGEPFRFANRPGVLRCRKCRRDTGLTVGTIMARSHTPLSVWFWSAYRRPAKHPACRPCSFGDNLACRATRRRSKSSTSSARGWCARIRTGSAAGPASTSKSMKPGSAAGRAAKAVASTIRFLSPALWRFASASRAPSSTSGRVVAMPGGFGSPSCRTAARSRSAASLRAPLCLVSANHPSRLRNLKTWLNGIHHGVSHQHLQAYLNEFTFRFEQAVLSLGDWSGYASLAKRGYKHLAIAERGRSAGPFATPSVPCSASRATSPPPTYAQLYSGAWQHPTCWGCG